MIGNDVVDLALATTESNWRRTGFLQKLFTEKEQRHILASDSPDIAVWTLWSKKESVYKIYNRERGIVAFNPLKFECIDFASDVTLVRGFGNIYFTATHISGAELYTIGVTQLAHIYQIQHLEMGSVVKIGNLPFVKSYDGTIVPCSVSHHGRYVRVASIN
ncbi:MAG TPA: 4'-phosphopantetheinyl transferase superfamily protein [Flavobacterium sp.]|nr:4'-phosphopantetheinyl transferase superfamily protein [Flavobacterium sp.]